MDTLPLQEKYKAAGDATNLSGLRANILNPKWHRDNLETVFKFRKVTSHIYNLLALNRNS